MASDILLVSKNGDFKGEASRHGEDRAIDVHSFSFGVTRVSQSTSRLLGAPAISSVNLVTRFDTGAAQLLALMIYNKEIEEATLIQYRAGGFEVVKLWSLTMKNVLIESMSFSGAGDDLPLCTFSLIYKKGTVEAMPQSEKGQAIDPMLVDYDVSAPI